MRNVRAFGSLGLALTVAACGGQKVDLGGGDGGSAGDSSAGAEAGGSSGSSSGGSSSGGSSPLSGTYKGYIESFTFPDGTDVVVMTLAFAADGTVTGTVFFGNGPPVTPPTDPSVGYPPGFGPSTQSASLLEGFNFTILDGTYTAPRLQLGFDQAQLWTKWCELQTAYPYCNCADDGGIGCPSGSPYACLPNSATGSVGSGCQYMPCGESAWTPIDCGRMSLCDNMGPRPCTCTAAGCTVPVPATGGITFDMQLSSGALDGSETGIGGSVLNVHLTKQP